jgi:hypothetical protein
MTGVTYDSGALIAAERGERLMWARHRALLLRRVIPTVPAPVVAQCWRGTPRQAQLARLLAGCEVETLDDTRARATGTLADRARTTDIVDTNVVEGALRRGDLIISSDEGDLAAIAAAVSRHIDIDHPLHSPPWRRPFANIRYALCRKGRQSEYARIAVWPAAWSFGVLDLNPGLASETGHGLRMARTSTSR